MMCAFILMRNQGNNNKRGYKINHYFIKLFDYCDQLYQSTLSHILKYPFLVALSIPATIILMIFLFITMPKGFMPNEDIGVCYAIFRAINPFPFKT